MLLKSKRLGDVRIAPLEEPYPADVADELAAMMPPGVAPIGLFRTFARNVPMTAAMRGWGRYELSRAMSLPMRQREIVILRTCARCGCEYEWGVHVAYFADRAELPTAQVASLTCGGSSDACWTDEIDRLLIDVVDALHDHAQLDDDLWGRAAGHLSDAQLLDALMLCGWYRAISYAANGLGVQPEPWAPRFADITSTTRAALAASRLPSVGEDAERGGPMTDVLQQEGPARRLAGEGIGWLTTVTAAGQPQASPVWFVWDGASLWLRSQAQAGKVRNIKANPGVAFHLADDGRGGNIITIEGTASLEADLPEQLRDAYFAKYGDDIRAALQTTPEQLAADYPTTVRITPTRTRAW